MTIPVGNQPATFPSDTLECGTTTDQSGTTTLEAAVAGCPLVVAYRTSALTYFAARRLVKIPHIGLVNVVAGRAVAPEFVQDALQPAAVADALEPLLDQDSAERATMVQGLARVRESLGTPGASRRVATMALEMAARPSRSPTEAGV